MKQPNNLINEKSPYLLQHAYNPVNWYPWGDEAFQTALASQKPIFLSIGYSTCHWCHVMEQESFEDAEVAAALNRDFICIKVDKEERPDVDAVYMATCQALTGSGGWPLSVFMTPEQKPFLAGTYYPKHRRYGHPGFLEVLEAVRKAWKQDRQNLLDAGEKIVAALSGTASGEELPANPKPVEDAVRQLAKRFDARYGGFGTPPKFPMPHNLLFLLRCHHLKVGEEPLRLVEETLTAMYRGGIFDHIGGGFSRYSTDEKWLAPHFEKMLYDNALLTMAYLECYQVTGNPLYRGVAEKTLAYIEREMTSPAGGFYSAQDADIEGEEGKFYTFTSKEISSALGEKDGNTFCARYDITPEGNFEGTSIPNLLQHKETSLPGASMQAMLDMLCRYRGKRYALHKDDKILTAWNALMIAAYAKAYRILGTKRYLESAEKAYGFLKQHLLSEDGSLQISYRDGASGGIGLLDDYAFLAWACLELYESTFEPAYLEHACALMQSVLLHFPCPSGGFYLSPQHGESLIFRPVESFDGAVPSGNSVAAVCLAKLAALTGETIWQEASDRQIAFFSEPFHKQPTAVTFALTALLQAVYPSQELVCIASDDREKIDLALKLGAHFHPQTAILVKSPDDENILGRIAAFTENYSVSPQGQTLFYLCQNQSCFAPETSLETILQQI